MGIRREAWKDPFVAANAVIAAVVLFCFFVHPTKYVRVQGECSSTWIDVDHPSKKPVCCDRLGAGGPCYPFMRELHTLTSGQGAWTVPLAVLLFNFATTIFLPKVSMRRVAAIFNRLALYFGIMVFRTVVLYIVFNRIERALFPRPEACWYGHLRRDKKCIDGFDHADHIVLYMVHFVAISCFEWKALGMEATHPAKRILLRIWLAAVFVVACYSIYHTAYSFHSAWESVVGMLSAQLFVMMPLYLLTRDLWRHIHPAFKLSHFVCQQ
ncbi:hypothetical protein H310_08805 [Aphanomyces invadans]|uniref:Uncharacterized protein n=1 Tax=Aphanomyces invadans TaxID=157072 RepID=A0A024TYL3_9STRA|nr:hypothetical protein H310_08805 [Aphanomyces invadans]ETV98726.1 hypothetical protein H310_08805 [Aphanomyces invadans]|eukprot:XP_008872923.1 hypothetical protein H310_08805 [Aphanomyces invadans]